MSLFGRAEKHEIADLQARLDRMRDERDAANRTRDAVLAANRRIARQFNVADSSAVQLERRLRRMVRAAARYRREAVSQERALRRTQRQLEDALGPEDPVVAAGDRWQARREDRPVKTGGSA